MEFTRTEEAQAFHANPSWETLRAFMVRLSGLHGSKDPEAQWEESLATQDYNPDAMAECIRRLPEYDVRARLGEIRIPALCLAGENDRSSTPNHVRIMAEGIPGAIFKIFPTGHGVIQNNPPGAGELVQEFISSVTASSNMGA